jgi:outer membrane protein assembly factor BamB
MVSLRGSCLGAVVVCFACAPHERPQEPAAPCPTGMAEIGGEGSGTLAVARVCMDITEVTTAAYGACVQAGVCTPAVVGIGDQCNLTDGGRADHPINCTTWEQAQTYCGWLGKRLPDDEEWIWAAQGGPAMTPYPWGRTPPDATRACWGRAPQGTCPVGSAPGGASPAGLLDLIGNVAEWTRGLNARGKPGDSAGARGRLRGGSHADSVYKQPIDERVADSARDEPTEAATIWSGLRCVVAPDTPVQEVDDSAWTPYVSTPGGLPPVLAATPTVPAPVRPLANLGILDRNEREEGVFWALGDEMIPAMPTVGAALGLTEHLQVSLKPAALKDFYPRRWIGDMVLMSNNSSYDLKFAAVDPTFKLRWQLALGGSGRSYMQVVTPRTLVVVFSNDASSALIGHALDTGREVWRVRGGDKSAFTHVKRLWHDGERVFALTESGVVALDANTGANLWVATMGACGVAAGPGRLVLEGEDGHRVIDLASGETVRKLGAGGRCSWGTDRWEGWTPGGVFAGDRLVAFDPPALGADEEPASASTLRAYDMTSGAELWRRPNLPVQNLVGDQDAVFVTDGERLLALDASDGVTRVEMTFGGQVSKVRVLPGGGEAGPLVVLDSYGIGQWILGRKPEPTAPEAYVIRGRLKPDQGLQRWQAGNVPVKVGSRVVRTGRDGRFEARGKTIGAVSVALGTDRGPEMRGGSRVRFEDTAVVLDGSGKYDAGDIVLYEWALY